MKTRWPVVFVLVLGGCATVPEPEPGWAPTATGCVDRGLFGALAWPDAARLGLTDVRIGRLPDTGNGPAMLVHFKRNYVGFGGFVAPPQVVLSVGDFGRRTCSIVVEEHDCPVAARLYQEFVTSDLPVAFLHDHPLPLSVIHGTMYFMASRDGRGGTIHWDYAGAPAHPFEERIDAALAELASCMAPASAAYRDVQPAP